MTPRSPTSPAERTFIFAGGGTGGHLYPGLAIAREIARVSGGSVRSIFLCSDRPLDGQILSKESVEFVCLEARPFSVRLRGLMAFMRTWGKAVRESRKIIRRAGLEGKGSVHVVAMGGFVAAPVVQAARVER